MSRCWFDGREDDMPTILRIILTQSALRREEHIDMRRAHLSLNENPSKLGIENVGSH